MSNYRKENPRTNFVRFRLTDEEQRILDQACIEKGLTKSQLFREMLLIFN